MYSANISDKEKRKLERERMDNQNLDITTYNYDTNQKEVTHADVSMWNLSKSMSVAQFAYLLDNFLNGGGGAYAGYRIGLMLRFTHRTLQRLAVIFALDILRGISEQEYTDARNEYAIETAKKITTMYDNGDFNLGGYI